MATIFYKTTGSFSALTPQKVVSGVFTNHSSTYRNAINTERTQGFTPSEAGDCEGIAVLLYVGGYSSSYSTTVKLQEYVGSTWTDRATKTINNETLMVNANGYSSYVWCYFEFASPYAITAVASTWRISVSGSSANSWYHNGSTVYNHAVVLADTTTYTSGDNILQNDGTTITVDQNIEADWWVMCNLSTITWGTTPAASYDLNIDDFQPTRQCMVTAGTEANPIPASKKAVFYVNNVMNPDYWIGSVDNGFRFYGAKPTNIYSLLSANALSGQKNIVLDDDFSADWQVGDMVVLMNNTYQTNTIASMSGNTITLTNNLSSTVYEGYPVYNETKKEECGVFIEKLSTIYKSTAVWKMSGIKISTTLCGGYATTNSSIVEPILMDTIIGGRTSYVGFVATDATTRTDCVFRNIFSYTGSWNAAFYFYCFKNPIHEDIVNATSSWVGGSGINANSNIAGTWTRVYVNGSSSTYTPFFLNLCNNSVLTDCKVFSATTSQGCKFTGSGYIINDSTFDGTGGDVLYLNNTDAVFNDCFFNPNSSPTYSIANADSTKNTVLFNNCGTITVNETAMATSINSYTKAHQFNQTANDHRSWWTYGKLVSTGDGLTDTTVRTSGTGKFALRFEPLSSTDNLTWDFTVPTGNIQNLTMTIFMWVKINSATYYAGTHQKPRLTIDYDNGTTAYAEASESTDWQLLHVTFTPTTTYGQITVTVSGKTDATGSNAYFYIDDFGIAYPPNVALDLGGLDNWASGLPVVPPLSLPISAGTVAQSVWQQLTTSSWGSGSFGEYVKTLTPAERIKYIDGGELPLY